MEYVKKSLSYIDQVEGRIPNKWLKKQAEKLQQNELGLFLIDYLQLMDGAYITGTKSLGCLLYKDLQFNEDKDA